MADYAAYTCSSTIAELAEDLTQNNAGTTELYTLTHGAFATLAHAQHTPQRVLTRYLARAMDRSGWPLIGERCTRCGTPRTPEATAREGTAEAPGRYLAFHTAHTYGQYTVLCPKCAPATDAPLTALTAEDPTRAPGKPSPPHPAEPPIKSSTSTSPPPKICWSTLSKPSGRSRRKPPQNNTRSARPCAPCHGKIANSTPGLYLAHI